MPAPARGPSTRNRKQEVDKRQRLLAVAEGEQRVTDEGSNDKNVGNKGSDSDGDSTSDSKDSDSEDSDDEGETGGGGRSMSKATERVPGKFKGNAMCV